MSNLGKDGGWDPRDHEAFIRVWSQFFDHSNTSTAAGDGLGTGNIFEQQLSKDSVYLNCGVSATSASAAMHLEGEGGETEQAAPEGEVLLSIPTVREIVFAKKLSTVLPWKPTEELEEHIVW